MSFVATPAPIYVMPAQAASILVGLLGLDSRACPELVEGCTGMKWGGVVVADAYRRAV
jgi:hypothetical protein